MSLAAATSFDSGACIAMTDPTPVSKSRLGRLSDKLSRYSGLIQNGWLLIISVVVVIAISAAEHASTRSDTAIQNVQTGRKNSLAVTCVIIDAFATAGRVTISSAGSLPESAFTRNLEKLGYPPLKVRQAQSVKAARGYVVLISDKVSAALGGKAAKRLVNKDGTIDCRQFKLIAHAAS